MAFIPLAEYRPDMPDFQNPGSGLIQNLLPRTVQSYAPMPGLTTVATALTARCQGAASVLDTAGTTFLFAGDASKLYKMGKADAGPSDVSKGGGYSTGSTERWSMMLFGSRLIATNFADNIQSYVMGSSAIFADMITSGQTDLKARYCAVIKDWPFFGNTSDGSNGAQPQRVWWGAIDDPTNFPTPGTAGAAAAQSDYQDLVGDFGWVQGIVGNLGTADGAIFQERGVTRVMFQGPPAVFSFQIAEGVRGTPAPGSICQLSNIAYYLGEDGFYAFDGTSSKPIGFEKVDKTFFAELDQSYFHRISACADPINKIVYWAVPVTGHTGGNPNKLYAYHWALDRWTISAVNDLQIEVLFRSLSFGQSLEDLDATYPSLDAMTISLDSRVLTGGRSLLSAFDATHKYSQFTGSNLAATADTSETQPIAGKRSLITNARPIVDGGTPSITPITRNRNVDAVTVGTAVAIDSLGNTPLRAEGRYFRGRITLPAGSSFTHLQGIDVPDDALTTSGNR